MKITRIPDRHPYGGDGPARPMTQREREIQAAIESSRSRSIELKCGHWTTWETIMAYAHWAPAKNKRFCETCNKWLEAMPKRKTAEQPMEPLF